MKHYGSFSRSRSVRQTCLCGVDPSFQRATTVRIKLEKNVRVS